MARTRKPPKELLGTFMVQTAAHESKKVFVCQNVTSYYHGDASHTKEYHLDSIHGKQVYPTDNPSVLSAEDGTLLHKKGH